MLARELLGLLPFQRTTGVQVYTFFSPLGYKYTTFIVDTSNCVLKFSFLFACVCKYSFFSLSNKYFYYSHATALQLLSDFGIPQVYVGGFFRWIIWFWLVRRKLYFFKNMFSYTESGRLLAFNLLVCFWNKEVKITNQNLKFTNMTYFQI